MLPMDPSIAKDDIEAIEEARSDIVDETDITAIALDLDAEFGGHERYVHSPRRAAQRTLPYSEPTADERQLKRSCFGRLTFACRFSS
jgi:hypothetical protein